MKGKTIRKNCSEWSLADFPLGNASSTIKSVQKTELYNNNGKRRHPGKRDKKALLDTAPDSRMRRGRCMDKPVRD